jgi:hypothetical protein
VTPREQVLIRATDRRVALPRAASRAKLRKIRSRGKVDDADCSQRIKETNLIDMPIVKE